MKKLKIDGFEYLLPKSSKIVGIILEDYEIVSFIVRPDLVVQTSPTSATGEGDVKK